MSIGFVSPSPHENTEEYAARIAAHYMGTSLGPAMRNFATTVASWPVEQRRWRAVPLVDRRAVRETLSSARIASQYSEEVRRDMSRELGNTVPRHLRAVEVPPVRRSGPAQSITRGDPAHHVMRVGAGVWAGAGGGAVVEVVGRTSPASSASKFVMWVDPVSGYVGSPQNMASMAVQPIARGTPSVHEAWRRMMGDSYFSKNKEAAVRRLREDCADARQVARLDQLRRDGDVLVPTRYGTFLRAVSDAQQRTARRLGTAGMYSLTRPLWSLPSIRVRGVSDRAYAQQVADYTRDFLLRRMAGHCNVTSESQWEFVFGRNSVPPEESRVFDARTLDDTYTLLPDSSYGVLVCGVTGRRFMSHDGAVLLDGRPVCTALLDSADIEYRTHGGEDGTTYVLLDGETAPRRSTLYGYHAGPRSYRNSYSEPRIGVELEVCCNRNNTGSRALFVREWQDEDGFILERDGSLDAHYGAEIISPPLPFAAYTEDSTWGRMLAWLRENKATSWYNGDKDYGMHVNLSRQYMSTAQQAILVMVTNRWSRLMRSIAGRETSFARFDPRHAGTLGGAFHTASECLHGTDKYSAVNCKRHVLEFRLFRGTLSWAGFMRNVQTVMALRAFVRSRVDVEDDIVLDDFDGPDLFLDYVQSERDTYPYLYDFLRDKNWIAPVDIPRITTDELYDTAIAAYAA